MLRSFSTKPMKCIEASEPWLARFKFVVKPFIPPVLLNLWRHSSIYAAKKMHQESRVEKIILDQLSEGSNFSPRTVSLRGQEFRAVDGPTFANIYREQFQQEVYRFNPNSRSPLIIDCGANVGIVTAYFKSIFPEARIIAFEPDPQCFAALQFNCSRFADVALHEAAVWTENGTISFSPCGAVGGYVSGLADNTRSLSIDVRAVRLRDFLVEPVDFLKLDIEGAEIDVLADCEQNLHNVKRMFVELHSFSRKPQRLAKAIAIIEQAGFRIHAHGSMEETQPFLGIPVYNNKDFRLNLFCYRSVEDEH